MPGKKESAPSWSFMTTAEALRSVVSAETADEAGIEAVEESISFSETDIARACTLVLGIMLGGSVTAATVKTYVNIGEAADVTPEWALVDSTDVTGSTTYNISGFYPGVVKVLVTDITGSGTITIVESHSK